MIIIHISQSRLTLWVAAIAQLIVQLLSNMTTIALPQIATTLNFPTDVIMWVNLIYLMSFVALSLPFSKIVSRFGVKKFIKINLLLLLVSVLISAFSINGEMFLLSRLLQGLTSASLAFSIYVLIVGGLEESKVGTALGIVSSAGYVGMLIAPVFMGFVLYFADWKLAFLILIPIVAILLLMLSKISFEWVGEERPVDKKGSFLYVVMMVLFTYGITVLNKEGILFLILCIILVVLFIKVEKRVSEPIFNFKLIRNIKYVIGNYAAMATYFTTTIAITILALHCLIILDFEEYMVGLVLVVNPIVMIVVSSFAGRISNRIDPRIISGIALIFITVSMGIFFLLKYIPFELIILGCVFQGIGNGLFSAPNNKYVLTLVDEKDLSDASSVLSTSKEFGKLVSSGIFSLILAVLVGNQSLGLEANDHLLIGSFNLMMFICVLVALSAAILLFYSKFKYGFSPNEGTVKFFKRIAPEWVKKRMGKSFEE